MTPNRKPWYLVFQKAVNVASRALSRVKLLSFHPAVHRRTLHLPPNVRPDMFSGPQCKSVTHEWLGVRQTQFDNLEIDCDRVTPPNKYTSTYILFYINRPYINTYSIIKGRLFIVKILTYYFPSTHSCKYRVIYYGHVFLCCGGSIRSISI